jgi:hypothetical protein
MFGRVGFDSKSRAESEQVAWQKRKTAMADDANLSSRCGPNRRPLRLRERGDNAGTIVLSMSEAIVFAIPPTKEF